MKLRFKPTLAFRKFCVLLVSIGMTGTLLGLDAYTPPDEAVLGMQIRSEITDKARILPGGPAQVPTEIEFGLGKENPGASPTITAGLDEDLGEMALLPGAPNSTYVDFLIYKVDDDPATNEYTGSPANYIPWAIDSVAPGKYLWYLEVWYDERWNATPKDFTLAWDGIPDVSDVPYLKLIGPDPAGRADYVELDLTVAGQLTNPVECSFQIPEGDAIPFQPKEKYFVVYFPVGIIKVDAQVVEEARVTPMFKIVNDPGAANNSPFDSGWLDAGTRYVGQVAISEQDRNYSITSPFLHGNGYKVVFKPISGYATPVDIPFIARTVNGQYPDDMEFSREYTPHDMVEVSSFSFTIVEGQTDQIGVRLLVEPDAGETVTVTAATSIISGVGQIEVATGVRTVNPTLQFTSADYDSWKHFDVTATDDSLYDPDEQTAFEVTLSFEDDDTGEWDVLTDVVVSGVVIDDDSAQLVLDDGEGNVPTVLVTTENGGTQSFTVALGSASTEDVTVTVTSTDSTEGLLTSVSPTRDGPTTSVDIVFGAGWTPGTDEPVEVILHPQDDGALDGDIAYRLLVSTSSTDTDYDGKASSIQVTNEDDETVTQSDYVFLPESGVDLGAVVIGSSVAVTQPVSIFNNAARDGGSALVVRCPAPFLVMVDPSSGYEDAAAGVEISAIPAGQSRTLRVKYVAESTARSREATVEFLTSARRSVVGVLPIRAETVSIPLAGTFSISPEIVIVPTEDDSVVFDIHLASAKTFSPLVITLAVPEILSDFEIETNLARTSGVEMAVVQGDGVLTLLYADPNYSPETATGGIEARETGDTRLVTISAEIDTSGGESVGRIEFQSGQAVNGTTVYTIGPAPAPTRTSPDFLAQGASVMVSDRVDYGNLDVNGDGVVNYRDVTLCYRVAVSGLTGSTLIPSASFDPFSLGYERILANVNALDGTSKIGDVNGDNTVDEKDIVLVYRYFKMKLEGAQLVPSTGGYNPQSLTPEQIEARIVTAADQVD
ncbi:MAG: hypothetical protein KAI66_08305 [Lentisphaeria bacterium]|nr:hypothetical protein [Lentisphaeria bacterium]